MPNNNPFIALTDNTQKMNQIPPADQTPTPPENQNPQPAQDTPNNQLETKSPPPMGDEGKAQKYINWLIDLVSKDKVLINHTDLKKFDLATMQDHYRISLNQYEIEISHCKQPDNGQDSFIILFNNIKQLQGNCSEKAILAYMPLSQDLFIKFKESADNQIERKRKEAEEKRFKEAMKPVDELLEKISSESPVVPETPLNIPPAQA